MRNAQYVTTSTGTDATFTPATADDAIYLSEADGTVTFMAYAPYQPSATPGGLPGDIVVDAALQVNPDPDEARRQQEKIDFLYANGATASKSSPAVRFVKVDDANDHSFFHAMARLVLIIESPAANGFDPEDVKRIESISLGGLETQRRFTFSEYGFGSNFVRESWRAEWDITHAVNTYDSNPTDPATGKPVGTPQRTYTLIIPPQWPRDGITLPAIPISITLDGNVYKNSADIKGNTNGPSFGFFANGKSYQYTIRLKKKSLEVTGATITDWTVGNAGTGDAVWQ